MGKFARPKVREYEFASLEQFVCDICEEFNEGYDLDILVSCEEAQDYITAIMATGKFKPQMIDYGLPIMDGYEDEYIISLSHFDDGELFVEKAWSDRWDKYIVPDAGVSDVTFVSENVSKTLYEDAVNAELNIVLFKMED